MARGTLRVYLGAAPGVGKTFAMLNEGHRTKNRGADVVVGLVETHGRELTLEQVGDLELVPRRVIPYRGGEFTEMDIDAILARKPERVLVDELAHTNVPGSRNEKRWQDVGELLDAGVDVITTVNIQHLESVNDVVEQITGVKQQETVPDEVVRAAEQVELVDMSPEALRRRMAHGNIYPAERIDTSLANYFRLGNLAALREIALLWVADRVEESLQQYLEDHGIDAAWETRERVVVALTGAPGGDVLIRRAARMARRAQGDLIGVHVRSSDGLAVKSAGLLEQHRRLLADVGGSYQELTADDVAVGLVQIARAERATQLVLGASKSSRWHDVLRGSVTSKVLRQARHLDVHVIATDESEERPGGFRVRAPVTGISRRREMSALVVAAVGLPLLTVVLAQLRADLGLTSVLLIYLLLVVGVAALGGFLPAFLAAIVAFLLANWYFTPPIHTWTISEHNNLIALVVFVVIGAVVGTLVSRMARRKAEALRGQSNAETLAQLGATLLSDPDPLPGLMRGLRSAFGCTSAAVLKRADGEWEVESCAGEPVPRHPDDADVTVELDEEHVLALTGVDEADIELLRSFTGQLSLVVERRRLRAEAAAAEGLQEANALRTALLAAVSHDLRTPLAGIKAAATSLLQRDIELSADSRTELLEAIDEEADRLTTLVGNLLDMSRLQTGGVELVLREVGLDEVVPAALHGLGALLPEDLIVEVPETLPSFRVDAALLERAVANLVANALHASPPGMPVRVVGGTVLDQVELRVVDQGRGIPLDQRERVFQPFQRLGDRPNGSGVGLGLAVAKGFIDVMGGELTVEDTPGGGTTMVMRFPICRHDAAVRRVSRVLVVDDEPQLLRALAINLRARGDEVDLARTGEQALELAARRHPDVVVLDLGLPGIDGVEVIRGLRGWSSVPIVVLSARDEEPAKVAALDAGADDYVTKPFGMDELLARLRAALRRAAPSNEQAAVTTDDFVIDLAAKRVSRDGEDVRLTPTEWHLVEVLARNRGKLVTQRQLLDEVWGPSHERDTNYLRVFMAQVRRKLEPEPSQPRYFITEPGMGYRFELA